MSEQEGTPKKVRRLETNDGEQNGSGRRSAPPSPSRLADNGSAPSTPPRPAVHRSVPSTPFGPAASRSPLSTPSKHFDYESAPSTSLSHAHESAPSTSSGHQFEGDAAPAPPEKFAHLNVPGREPTSALVVIEEDVDMEDANKPGPSKPLDASKSPSRLKAIIDLPKSPLSKWLHELGAGLNSFSNSMLGCVRPSEVETYEWVCSFRYKPFGVEKQLLGEVYRDGPPHRTHLQGLAIKDVCCFEVSTRKLQRLPAEVVQKLGVRVTFPSQSFSNCPVNVCSRCHLYDCEVCPHLILCNCTTKETYRGGQWCPHIHVAYARNMDVYGEEVCLFIQEDLTNLTEKRHIRALIQGPNKMCRVEENLYAENFEFLVRSERYHVMVNTSKIPKRKCVCKDEKKCIHCKACWCRYSCTCEDYWFDRQVCEHIHNVAMQERKGVGLEEQFSFNNFKESEVVYIDKPDTEDKIYKERAMMAEHESSYHFPLKYEYVKEIEKGRKWRLASARDRVVATVSINPKCQSSCICKKPSTTKASMCVICNICAFHYKCDCLYAEELPVCRHMHALARFRQLEVEPTDDSKSLAHRLEHYGSLIAEYEKKLRYTEKMPIRKPIGVTRND